MKNRLLSIFTAIAVILSLSACQNGNTEQTAPLSDSATTIVEEAVEMKTIAPPEDGWTIEKLVDTICFNGKPIQLPLSIDKLGEKYYYKDEDVVFSDTSAIVPLIYEEKVIALMVLKDCTSIEDVSSAHASGLILSVLDVDKSMVKHITINGISLFDNTVNLSACLGNPTQDNDGVWIYNISQKNEQIMSIHYNENNEITDIYLHLN